MPFQLTPTVKALVIACFAFFLIQKTGDQFFGTHIVGQLGLVPAGFVLDKKFWQLFTYPFLHGDVMHLFFNMMMLVFIGGEIEAVWGRNRFLRYFAFCAGMAGLSYLGIQLFVWGDEGLRVPMIGASGAIYGLLVAYGILFAERTLLFMMLFPVKAKWLVVILGAIEFLTGIYSGRGGLASVAHLAGMVAGVVYLWSGAAYRVWKRKQANRPAKPKATFRQRAAKVLNRRKGHLKLVVDNDNKDWDKQEPKGKGDPKTWH